MTVECKCHALSTEELTLETSCCSLNSAAINLPLLRVTIGDSVKCGCGRRMRTADADGGRRMADGGRRMRTADKTKNKNQKKFKKYRNKYKNKNNQLTSKKRKRHVEISPGTSHNKNDNY